MISIWELLESGPICNAFRASWFCKSDKQDYRFYMINKSCHNTSARGV